MKILKNIQTRLMVMAAFVLGACATVSAQEKLTVEPISIAPGEEAEVVLNYSSEVERSGYQIDVILPEGLSFVKTVNEDDEEEVFTFGSSETKAHMKDETFHGDSHIRVVVFHMKMKNLKDGVLFTFKVKADETLAENSEIKFEKIKFNGGEYLEPFTCAVTNTTANISNIEVAGSENAPVYNVAGMRVNDQTKGLVIKNGKKFINK